MCPQVRRFFYFHYSQFSHASSWLRDIKKYSVALLMMVQIDDDFSSKRRRVEEDDSSSVVSVPKFVTFVVWQEVEQSEELGSVDSEEQKTAEEVASPVRAVVITSTF